MYSNEGNVSKLKAFHYFLLIRLLERDVHKNNYPRFFYANHIYFLLIVLKRQIQFLQQMSI